MFEIGGVAPILLNIWNNTQFYPVDIRLWTSWLSAAGLEDLEALAGWAENKGRRVPEIRKLKKKKSQVDPISYVQHFSDSKIANLIQKLQIKSIILH